MLNDITLRVAQIVPCTEAEGPGKRFALWFQGCPLRCAECCNPEMLPFDGGEQMTLSEVARQMQTAKWEQGIEGITLIGGEPTAHAPQALAVTRAAHELDLSTMLFTGYVLEELRERDDDVLQQLINETDMLVDGPYDRENPETERRWIGSKNQRVHYLTDRCDPEDPRWKMKNTLEIRLINQELSVNGFPAKSAVGLWKRPRPARKKDNDD